MQNPPLIADSVHGLEHNAETYYLIGEAMGTAMKKLCEKKPAKQLFGGRSNTPGGIDMCCVFFERLTADDPHGVIGGVPVL